MSPKKTPAALEGGSGAYKTTLWNSEYSPCAHDLVAMVRIDCRAGGIQYRKYCTACWRALTAAIPHAEARDEEQRTGIQAPVADLQIIYLAQDCYARRERNGGRP